MTLNFNVQCALFYDTFIVHQIIFLVVNKIENKIYIKIYVLKV